MIRFSVPSCVGTERNPVKQAIARKICADGMFTQKCNTWTSERFGVRKVLLTASCTTTPDMAAPLCALKPGDEMILPSFTLFCNNSGYNRSERNAVQKK